MTRFEYRLQPVGELLAGLVLYPRSAAGDFLRTFAELTAEAPDRMSSMAAFLSTPDGDPVVGVFAVYHGTLEEGERVLSPLRSLGSPLLDDIAPKPYTVVQQAFDPGFPAGVRNYWKSTYLSNLPESCIDALVEHANRAPSPMNIVGLEHMLGGAVARVDEDETAFSERSAEYNLLILGMCDDPGVDEANRTWAREMWAAMQPFSTGTVYVNYMSQDDSDRIDEAYSSKHHARLVELKNRYDPENLFRLNQNIAPSVE